MAKTNCETCQHDDEIWKDIPGYEGKYQVSNLGRIRSLDRWIVNRLGKRYRHRGRVLKPCPNNLGYMRVDLGKRNSVRVHVQVMAAFVGPRPDGMVIAHGNGNCSDNRLANLRYTTPQDNEHDKVLHGTNKELRKTHCPRGHLLVEQNLRAATKGDRRLCLACDRARSAVRRKYGLKSSEAPDLFKRYGDQYYSIIMKEIPK